MNLKKYASLVGLLGILKASEAGKLADLLVLNESFFDVDRDKIWKVKAAAVLMEVKVIHDACASLNQDP